MRMFVIAVSVLLLAGAVQGMAQTTERYRLEPAPDGGYVRMDVETGRMALCSERSGQLVCRMAVEDRDAYEDEIGALRAALAALEARVAALEAGDGLPSDEEFDRSLGMMEKFFRRFMGVIQEFERDFGAEPPTDRT